MEFAVWMQWTDHVYTCACVCLYSRIVFYILYQKCCMYHSYQNWAKLQFYNEKIKMFAILVLSEQALCRHGVCVHRQEWCCLNTSWFSREYLESCQLLVLGKFSNTYSDSSERVEIYVKRLLRHSASLPGPGKVAGVWHSELTGHGHRARSEVLPATLLCHCTLYRAEFPWCLLVSFWITVRSP